jgi:hypothetical protein
MDMAKHENSYGEIELENGKTFQWMRGGGDGEIWGAVWNEDGSIAKNTSGWYRTTDVDKAAKLAAQAAGGKV